MPPIDRDLVSRVDAPTYTGIEAARTILGRSAPQAMRPLIGPLFADPISGRDIESAFVSTARATGFAPGAQRQLVSAIFRLAVTASLIPDQLLPELCFGEVNGPDGYAYTPADHSITVDTSRMLSEGMTTGNTATFVKEAVVRFALGLTRYLHGDAVQLSPDVAAMASVYFPTPVEGEIANFDPDRIHEAQRRITIRYEAKKMEVERKLSVLFENNTELKELTERYWAQEHQGSDLSVFEMLARGIPMSVMLDASSTAHISPKAITELMTISLEASAARTEYARTYPQDSALAARAWSLLTLGNSSIVVEAGGARGPLRMPLEEASRSVFFDQLADAAMQRKAQLLADPLSVEGMLGGGSLDKAAEIAAGAGIAMPDARAIVMIERDFARGAEAIDKAVDAVKAVEKSAKGIERTIKK